MAIDVVIDADLWEEDAEGVISCWLFDDGEAVAKGDILAEILVEKVTHELEAPEAGTLKIIAPAEEQPVSKGDKVAEIL